jgi:prolipoprotein diacylglyceryltransferase
MHPIFIQMVNFTIRWYGVMIATACFVAVWIAGTSTKIESVIFHTTYFKSISEIIRA